MKEVKKEISFRAIIIFMFGMLMLSGIIVMMFTASYYNSDNMSEKEKTTSSGTKTAETKKPTPKEQIVAIKINLKFDKKEEKVSSKTISSWVSGKVENGREVYKTDDAAIKEYASELAEKYSTYVFSIPFKTVYGEEIDIENKSTGWILDEDYAFKAIKNTLLERKSLTANLTDKSDESKKWWLRIAGEYKDYSKYGNTYVEVSINDQHMWAYKKGEIVLESDIVSGQPDLGNDTPTGAFLVGSKKEDATLYGPGYNTVVSYWITIQDDIGFHDAEWQEEFGGLVYLTHGSHGCVNLPTYAASTLYDLVYQGMPVFIY